MYEHRYIQYLNLPAIPNDIIERIMVANITTDSTKKIINPALKTGNWWTDTNNQELNQWCCENICADMYYAFQIMVVNSPMHKDTGTLTKINYILNTGGDNVLTEFYADDRTTKLASYKLEPKRWHIFKADTYHEVNGIEPGKTRFAVTSRIFGK